MRLEVEVIIVGIIIVIEITGETILMAIEIRRVREVIIEIIMNNQRLL